MQQLFLLQLLLKLQLIFTFSSSSTLDCSQPWLTILRAKVAFLMETLTFSCEESESLITVYLPCVVAMYGHVNP